MPFTSQNLKLPYIAPAQAQKHVTHNEALRGLDAIVQLSLVSVTQSTPPNTPLEGSRYFVATTATDAWENHDGQIAAFQDGAWTFYLPQAGWLAWIEDQNILQIWGGTAWQAALPEQSYQNLEHVGINASANTTNRLSVSSPATLLNHAGAGHQLKLNKNTTPDTASVLFQTNWSGRAEIGLTGDDDFHFKVSPDGNTFHDALFIDKNTGNVGVGALPTTNFEIASTAAATGLRLTSDTVSWEIRNNESGNLSFGVVGANKPFKFSPASDANLFRVGISASNQIDLGGVLIMKNYTLSTLPSAVSGGLIYVSDETGGSVLAFSDGTNWRRVTDRALVS